MPAITITTTNRGQASSRRRLEPQLCHARERGHPVFAGLAVLLKAGDYWIARSSRAMTISWKAAASTSRRAPGERNRRPDQLACAMAVAAGRMDSPPRHSEDRTGADRRRRMPDARPALEDRSRQGLRRWPRIRPSPPRRYSHPAPAPSLVGARSPAPASLRVARRSAAPASRALNACRRCRRPHGPIGLARSVLRPRQDPKHPAAARRQASARCRARTCQAQAGRRTAHLFRRTAARNSAQD